VSEPSSVETTTPADEPAGAPASGGRDRTGRDMLLALACLFLPILAIGGLLRACGSEEPTVVDSAPALDDARAAGLFPVEVPEGLDEGWRTVQAGFQRGDGGTVGTLRLGYLTPSDGQVLLVESNEDSATLLPHELGDEVRPDGEVIVDERAWTRSVVRGDERALVQIEDVRIIVIVGRAPDDELTALADSLR
jgi:Protein of unknown function (DUF4245)